MNLAVAWLLNVAMQSILLLIAALLLERVFTLRNSWRELLWRAALFGGVFTATLQLAFTQAPLAGRWHWTQQAAPIASSAASAPAATTPVAAITPKPSVKTSPVVTPSATVPSTNRLEWPSPRWLLALWLLGAFLMSGRTLLRWRGLQNALADATPLDDESLMHDATTIADRAQVRPPQLFILDALPSPIALLGRRIVLPAWAVTSLDRAHLRAMIAHETAHIARRDPAWKALIAGWRAIFWFVPSAFAQRRLDDLAELACDAFAAECLGNARGLAECLAVCAEHHVGIRTFDFAPAMAARPSSLMLRIDRLLEGVAMETAASGTGARAVALVALAASALALPAIGIDTVAQAASAPAGMHASLNATLADGRKDSHSSISIHSDSDNKDDESTIVSESDDKHSFTANIRGKLMFNDDESDIVLSNGGTAKLEENAGGTRQRIELTERGGKLERRYYVDNTERPYDDKARAFMTAVVVDLARSGIDAEGRAKRLYAQGGAKRVLDEIDRLHSDYAGGIYLRTLLDAEKLGSADLDRAIAIAGAFGSDYERRQSLTYLFDKQPLDAPRQIAFLHQAEKFSSDYDRAETLVEIVPHLADSRDVRQAWLDAARGLHSDYDRRRT
jgi:beta-lactamase regulating signal transducer with metallopeptidase domain